MTENRRYYYLKLKEYFFNSETMMILESMQDGLLYSNLLLKMYLMSLKSGGILLLGDHFPHTPQTIATCTRHQIGTVERALKIFLQLGLIEILADGAYYMTDIQLLIGQSSTEGERKKRERTRLQRQKLLPTGGLDICPPNGRVDKCPPIVEKEKDIELEIDKERELRGNPAPPFWAAIKMFSLRTRNRQSCKPTSPPSGRSTLSGCPSTWPPLAGPTRATPPPFAAG